MTKPLVVRLPEELQVRLQTLKAQLTTQAGGVEQDFSKVVRHVLTVGLAVIEKGGGQNG